MSVLRYVCSRLSGDLLLLSLLIGFIAWTLFLLVLMEVLRSILVIRRLVEAAFRQPGLH